MSLLTVIGVVAVLAGGALVATNTAVISSAATTTLALSTTAPGATCNDSNPAAPVCSGLAAGEIVHVSGTGFTPGSLASIVQCNSEPSQPVILFLGADVPVSCSPLALVTIPSKGKTKGTLSGDHTLTTGTVGPPVTGQPTTCTQVVPSTSVITGCSTSTDAATDALLYPCPPTPAQQAAGDTCVLAIGDQAGDRGIGTILFGTETLPTTTTTTISGSTTTTGGTTTTTGGTTTTTGGTTTTTGATTTTTGATTTTTSPTGTSTATQVSPPTVTLGPSGSVADSVTVQGTVTNGSPTGSVNFYACQTGTSGTLTTGPCAATAPNHLSTVHLGAGPNNTAVASSGAFVPTSAGTWCFSAVYGGDTTYTGSADDTDNTNLDPNECVLVSPSPSTTSSFISAAVVTLGPGGNATDSVTVAGNVAAGAPAGNVAFYACHTSVAATLTPGPCPVAGFPEDFAEALAPGAGATSGATSVALTPYSVGTWCFSAVYAGSSLYAASSDNTDNSNLDANECFLVAPGTADAFTNDPFASGLKGTSFSFAVTTSGSPTPALKKKGRLPKGMHFVDNHNGTATLSGTPSLKSIGVYHITFVAKFGTGKTKKSITQNFTLTVS